MRSGTENVAGIVGTAAALKWMNENLQKHHEHLLQLKFLFIEGLQNISSEIVVNGPSLEDSLPTILNVRFPNVSDPLLLQMSLDIEGISASIGSACASGSVEQSHVLKAIGIPSNQASIRFSFSPLNTEAEIDEVLKLIEKVLVGL